MYTREYDPKFVQTHRPERIKNEGTHLTEVPSFYAPMQAMLPTYFHRWLPREARLAVSRQRISKDLGLVVIELAGCKARKAQPLVPFLL